MNYLILLLIAVIFVPGFAWAFADVHFFGSKHKSFSFFIAKSFMFGIVTYMTLGLFFFAGVDLNALDSNSDYEDYIGVGPALELIGYFGDILTNPTQIVKVDGMVEVRDLRGELLIPIVGFLNLLLLAIPVSIALISVWVYLKSLNFLARLLNLFGVTESLGRNDLWSNVLGRSESRFRIVRLIDFETNYVCEGNVDSYSEGEEKLAILLEDVRIYNLVDSSIDYRIPNLYVSDLSEKIWMEFPGNDKSKESKTNVLQR